MSQLNGYVFEIEYVSRESDSDIIKIMRAIKSEPTCHKKMTSIYKMLATVILKRCLPPRCGLRKNSDEIIYPIVILKRQFMHGFDYIPSEEYENKA